MEEGSRASSPNSSEISDSRLGEVIRALARAESPLDEDLLIFGSGPLPIAGSHGGAVGLDRNGDVVLVATIEDPSKQNAEQLADELDRLGQMSADQLADLQTGARRSLPEAHQRHFKPDPGSVPTQLNRSQKAIVVAGSPIGNDVWRTLLIELGRRLARVYVFEGDALRATGPPQTLTRRPKRFVAGTSWPLGNWIGLAAVLLGVGMALLGLFRLTSNDAAEKGSEAVESPVRDVALGTPSDATHSQWIGQRRLLRTSRGKLIALFAAQDGLHVVSDSANQGRSWRAPVVIPEISATSFSAAVDERDRIQVAFSDGDRVSFASIEETSAGWTSGPVLDLGASSSPVVQAAWDPVGGLTQVVWVKEDDGGQAPFWAAVSTEDEDGPAVKQTRELAEAGAKIPVLGNVGAGAEVGVVATYRRGDSSLGWFSRSAIWDETQGIYDWGPEEQLPTEEGFGAASLAVDPEGAAHLVLRDSTSFELTYFRKTGRSGWSSGATAVDADSVAEIDFPTLSVDQSSRLVYLFFQTTGDFPEVRVAIRDPVTGWEGPYTVTSPSLTPEGASFPSSMETADGQSIVLWTKGGENPAIQAARVAAP